MRRLGFAALAVLLAAVLQLSNPTLLPARSFCDKGEDIVDDDYPFGQEFFHAKSGTGEQYPNADPFGEEEWTFLGETSSEYEDMHSAWEAGQTQGTHGACGGGPS